MADIERNTTHYKLVTSMIDLCHEGESSPDALQRSAGTNLFDPSARVLASWPLFLLQVELGFHWVTPRSESGLGQKTEFVFSYQSRNLSMGAPRACGLAPSPLNGEI
jgi:hypothetical protein